MIRADRVGDCGEYTNDSDIIDSCLQIRIVYDALEDSLECGANSVILGSGTQCIPKCSEVFH